MVFYGTNAPMSYGDLTTAPDLVVKKVIEAEWGFTRRQSALVSILNMIGDKGAFGSMSSIKAKNPKWAIGDFFDEHIELLSDLDDDASGVTLATNELKTGDLIAIVAHSAHTGGSNSEAGDWSILRITNNGTPNSGDPTHTDYTISRIGNSTAGTGSPATQTTLSYGPDSALILKVAPAATYDDVARELNNVRGDLMDNFMQRMRDTVGVGLVETSEDFLADHSLEHLMRMARQHYARKLNLSLYTNHIARIGGPRQVDFGIFGGLPYFLNPEWYNPTDYPAMFTDTTIKRFVANESYVGQNYVSTNSTFDIAEFEDWIGELTNYGSGTKVIFGNKAVIMTIYRALMTRFSIQRENIVTLDVSMPNIWEALTVSTPAGDIQLVMDQGLRGVTQTVFDNMVGLTRATTPRAVGTNWVVAVDMSYIKPIYLDMKDKGVQTPHIANIDMLRNTTIKEAEIDSTFTLAIKDPRAMGYFAFGGTTP